MSGHIMRDYERLSAAIDAIAVHVERYETHADRLRRARAEQAGLLRDVPALRPRLDDVEAELTYLRLRVARPSLVVQVGCRDGWSTAWILRALRDNGHGRLVSFNRTNLLDDVIHEGLAADRWDLVLGDVRDRTAEIPRPIDYLFVDGESSAGFARWYLPNLVAGLAPGAPVGIGGVFAHHRPRPFGEAALIVKWLDRNHIDYFTAAPAREPVIHRQLNRVRWALGFNDDLGGSDRNPMVFFDAP